MTRFVYALLLFCSGLPTQRSETVGVAAPLSFGTHPETGEDKSLSAGRERGASGARAGPSPQLLKVRLDALEATPRVLPGGSALVGRFADNPAAVRSRYNRHTLRDP
jgi:hypothetical protein